MPSYVIIVGALGQREVHGDGRGNGGAKIGRFDTIQKRRQRWKYIYAALAMRSSVRFTTSRGSGVPRGSIQAAKRVILGFYESFPESVPGAQKSACAFGDCANDQTTTSFHRCPSGLVPRRQLLLCRWPCLKAELRISQTPADDSRLQSLVDNTCSEYVIHPVEHKKSEAKYTRWEILGNMFKYFSNLPPT